MLLYLIRHGHADWTQDEDRPLSARGHLGAALVARLLAGEKIDAIFSSPYQRAIQTVEPLATALSLDVFEDVRFRERILGNWKAASFDEAVHMTWTDFQFAHHGGETNQMAQARAIDALKDLLSSPFYRRLAISTHGNLMALILNHYDPDVSYEFWTRLTMPDIYRVKFSSKIEVSFTRVWE